MPAFLPENPGQGSDLQAYRLLKADAKRTRRTSRDIASCHELLTTPVKRSPFLKKRPDYAD
jgi:hypothetical protein